MANKIIKNGVEVESNKGSVNELYVNTQINKATTNLTKKINKRLAKFVKTEDIDDVLDTTSMNPISNKAVADKLSQLDLVGGGEENIIEYVSVDGTIIPPDTNRNVNIDLSGKENVIEILTLDDYNNLSNDAKKDKTFIVTGVPDGTATSTVNIPTVTSIGKDSTHDNYPTAKAVYDYLSTRNIDAYTKTETYSTAEIDSMLDGIERIVKQVVLTLPSAAEAEENVLYLLSTKDGSNRYIPYMLINGDVVPLTQDIDLSQYVKKEAGKGLSEVNVTQDMVDYWNSKSNFDGNYNNLIGAPSSMSLAYKLTEAVNPIGTWIDGRTIYRKVYDLSSSITSARSTSSPYYTAINGRYFTLELPSGAYVVDTSGYITGESSTMVNSLIPCPSLWFETWNRSSSSRGILTGYVSNTYASQFVAGRDEAFLIVDYVLET